MKVQLKVGTISDGCFRQVRVERNTGGGKYQAKNNVTAVDGNSSEILCISYLC